MPPTVCQPKAAATRSRSPSPSKSAACTSAVRAILSTRTIFSNCRGAVWRSHTMLPFSWSPGMKSPRSATSRSCFPSLSRSTISAWSGLGIRAISRTSPGFFDGLAEVDDAVAHVAGDHLEPAVAVEVEEAHVRDDGDAGHSARVHRVLAEAKPAVARRPGLRQGQADGRARLEVPDELRGVHLPQDALLARGHARAHEAALGHLLDAQAPHAAGQVLGLRRDVALRALLLDGLDERRVGQRVGLAVEAEDDGPRRGSGGLRGAEGRDEREGEKQEGKTTSQHHQTSLQRRPIIGFGAPALRPLA